MKDSALAKLGPKDRLRLLRFVCSFAWTDLEIREEERAFVSRLIDRLGLDDEEREKAHGWLVHPPSPDTIDPGLVPVQHRQLFLDACQGVLLADGEISAVEAEDLEVLRQLLG